MTRKALALMATGAWLAWRAYRRMNRISLAGKVVLVTGGSRGLGLALARQLVQERARVAICARNADDLERARAQLGPEVLTFACDLTNQAEVAALVHEVQSQLGPIDALINNAGTIAVGPLDSMTLQDYQEAMQTHYWAPLYTILAVIPEMRQRGGGHIVNITSIGGKISVPHLLPYSASKFALVGLSEGLRAELKKDNIIVTTVVPGLMRTGSPRNALFKGQHQAEHAWFHLSDAVPGVSINADRAARQILCACKEGRAEIVLSLPAKVAVRLHGLLPGMSSRVLEIVNRLLPGPGGIGTERALGKDSESAVAPSVLTALSNRAAQKNNEVSPEEALTHGK